MFVTGKSVESGVKRLVKLFVCEKLVDSIRKRVTVLFDCVDNFWANLGIEFLIERRFDPQVLKHQVVQIVLVQICPATSELVHVFPRGKPGFLVRAVVWYSLWID